MINQRYLSTYSNEKIDIIKSYVFLKVIEKTMLPYFYDYMRDILVRNIKYIIEEIIKVRSFQIDELVERIKNENTSIETWIDYPIIIKNIIEEIKTICPNAIDIEQNEVNIKGEILINCFYEILE
ncbi:MAG: hypothetical protein IJZ00_01370 [Lachnospiraceae bacterium]|nr:hypothetical protein [Lachnospiraceae bacterium]